jgi:hypothetical protein
MNKINKRMAEMPKQYRNCYKNESNEERHLGFEELRKAVDRPCGAKAYRKAGLGKGSSDRTHNYIRYVENFDKIEWCCNICSKSPAPLIIDKIRCCEKCKELFYSEEGWNSTIKNTI